MTRAVRILVLAAAMLGVPGTAAAATGVVVHATVDRQRVGLGEPFVYTVDVKGPAGLTVFADVSPFVAAAPPKRSQAEGGTVVQIEQRLICLDRACAPNKISRTVALPRVRVTGAGSHSVVSAPATITVVPHVPESAVTAARARYRIDDHVRAAGAPWGAAVAILAALAVACLVAAVLLLVRSRRPAATTSSVSRSAPGGIAYALRLLRESARRPVPDRRRAADYVARTVGEDGPRSAAEDARRLAWAAPDPQPPEIVALADRVETTSGSEA
jgi:hypothetical protein